MQHNYLFHAITNLYQILFFQRRVREGQRTVSMSHNATNATAIEFAISRERWKGPVALREVGDQVLHTRYYFQGAVTVTNGTWLGARLIAGDSLNVACLREFGSPYPTHYEFIFTVNEIYHLFLDTPWLIILAWIVMPSGIITVS